MLLFVSKHKSSIIVIAEAKEDSKIAMTLSEKFITCVGSQRPAGQNRSVESFNLAGKEFLMSSDVK